MSNTATALISFIAWTLALLVLMETIRTYLVLTGKVPANGFTPGNDNLSPFMQRLARVHANCIDIRRNTCCRNDAGKDGSNPGHRKWVNGAIVEYTPPPVPIDLTAYAANARWVKETSGITVAGVAIATDDRSKQMIMGARIAADADSTFTTHWVASDGSISTLTAPQIIAISDAVLAHVAACFAKYADVKSQVDAGTITTTTQIDATFAVG